MSGLKLTNIKKAYGKTEVLHGIDLEIAKGEFIVFVGPSGCGKSTLLRMIAGLEEISSGDLMINATRMNDMPASMRGIAMVFQTYALYPHMSVYDNMAFGMRIAKQPKEAIDQRVRLAAEMLQLTDYLDRLPKALSGGQRQRVAIGRAIVRNPDVFLFDEPLSNLDAALRVQTRIEIANLKEELPDTTMIYVTHDQVEAMTLADRIVVLNGGYIEQVGTPLEVYTDPHNTFVAKFIGSPSMNMVPVTLKDAGPSTHISMPNGASLEVPISSDSALNGSSLQLGIRPEDVELCNDEAGLVEGSVMFVESLGEVTLVHTDIGEPSPFVGKFSGIIHLEKGQKVRYKMKPNAVHLFNGDGQSLKHLSPTQQLTQQAG